MKPGIFAAVAALLIGVVPGLSAQQSAVRPAASMLFRVEAPRIDADTMTPPQTYWKEGALIVGIPSAILGTALGVGLCGLNESADRPNCAPTAIGFGLLMGILGAIPGALIGGQFHKAD